MQWLWVQLAWLQKRIQQLRGKIYRFDAGMRDSYRPQRLAAIGVALVGVLVFFQLMVPECLGLSNDGSFDVVLRDCGLERLDKNDNSSYYNYYERVYRLVKPPSGPTSTPITLRAVVQTAIVLDMVVTGDDLFDMRTLAGLYLAAYLAVLYPLFKVVLGRVDVYSKGLLLQGAGVLIYADVALVTRFASFYTHPLELIFFLAMTDAVFMLLDHPQSPVLPLVLCGAAVALMYTNPYCALVGMVVSLCYWRLAGRSDVGANRALCILCAMVLCFVSVSCNMRLVESQTLDEKYDQMTRGVLFEAENPEEALAAFGIEPRYSVLTGTYSNQEFPVVFPESGLLDEGFFDRYTTMDVVLYYMQHPGSMLGLVNQGIQRAFLPRNDYSGNYEVSAGRPPKAKSPFMAIWSTFKERFAPRSMAGVLFLILAIGLLRISRSSLSREEKDQEGLYKFFWAVVLLVGLAELMTVLVLSGDSQLMNESFFMSLFIDLLVLMLLAEILHKLKNIVSED